MSVFVKSKHDHIDVDRDTYIFICCNIRDKRKACGNSGNVDSIYEYFRQTINNNRSKFKEGRIVKINKSGCLSRCAIGPNIVVFPDNVWYGYQSLEDIDEIINEHLIGGRIVTRLLLLTNYEDSKEIN